MTDNISIVLDQFRRAARNFIQTVDSAADMQLEAFLSGVSRSLAELYSSALQLPAVEPDTSGIDTTPFAIEAWAKLYNSLREKIGSLDGYWRTFDSTDEDSPVQGSLAGDISEIYFDLKEDLQLEETGIPQADFLWELRCSFRTHWGRHLLGALAAIYDRQIE